MVMQLMIFEGKDVEVFEHDGIVLFNPRHVGECLGISDSAIRMNLREMNEKKKIKLKNSDVNSTDIRKLNNAGEVFVTESGVYDLIFKSRKAEAIAFKDWVTDEVLPTIRKSGGYVADPKLIVDTYFSNLGDEKKVIVEGLFTSIHNQQQQILEMQPKVKYLDTILEATNGVNISQIAKDYGLSALRLNSILHGAEVQYKQGSQWLLYAKYQNKGYTTSSTHLTTKVNQHGEEESTAHIHTKWTQKGRKFIHLILEKIGIQPLCDLEQEQSVQKKELSYS